MPVEAAVRTLVKTLDNPCIERPTACAKSPLTPVSSRSASQGDFAHPTTRAVCFRLWHIVPLAPRTAFPWVLDHEQTLNCPGAASNSPELLPMMVRPEA